jgi:ribonuclease HII
MKKTEKKNTVDLLTRKTAIAGSVTAVKTSSKKDLKSTTSGVTEFLLGADEVGRGPLAGPVTVCAAMIQKKSEATIKKELKRLSGKAYPIGKDSKKMTETEREFWFECLQVLGKLGDIYFFVGSKSAKDIDKKGIAVCIKDLLDTAVTKAAETQAGNLDLEVRLDAGLKTSIPVYSQKAIVKGDEKEFVISIASVYAKVTRDMHMKKLSKKGEFAMYEFGIHKGYGTLKHRQAIKKFGLSKEHRKSFCKNI